MAMTGPVPVDYRGNQGLMAALQAEVIHRRRLAPLAERFGFGKAVDGGGQPTGRQHLSVPSLSAQARRHIYDGADRRVAQAILETDTSERRGRPGSRKH